MKRVIQIICIICIISFVFFTKNKLQSQLENTAKEYLFANYQATYIRDIKVNISVLGITFTAEDVEDKRSAFSAKEIKLFYPFFSKDISINFPKKIIYHDMIINSKKHIKIIATSSKYSMLSFFQKQSFSLEFNALNLGKTKLFVRSNDGSKEFNVDIDLAVNKRLDDEVLLSTNILISNITWPNKYFDGNVEFKFVTECKYDNNYLKKVFIKNFSMSWPLNVDLFSSGNIYLSDNHRLLKMNIIINNIDNIMRYQGVTSANENNKKTLERIIYLLKNDSQTKHYKSKIEFDISTSGKEFLIGSYSLQQFVDHMEKNNE